MGPNLLNYSRARYSAATARASAYSPILSLYVWKFSGFAENFWRCQWHLELFSNFWTFCSFPVYVSSSVHPDCVPFPSIDTVRSVFFCWYLTPLLHEVMLLQLTCPSFDGWANALVLVTYCNRRLINKFTTDENGLLRNYGRDVALVANVDGSPFVDTITISIGPD